MTVQVPTLKFKAVEAPNVVHDTIPAPELIKAEFRANVLSAAEIQAAVSRAGRRIAPLWPLRNFVAVNPFWGLLDQPFADAMQTMVRHAGARMTAPRTFYAQALEEGRITQDDLAAALVEQSSVPGAPQDVAALEAFARSAANPTMYETVPTVADVTQFVTGNTWEQFIRESISRWAAAHFDQGQAYWKSPWRDLAPYPAWRAEAAIDRAPEVAGVPNFRRIVNSLPEAVDEAIAAALAQLAISADALDAYLYRLLLTNSGWAGHARYQLWQAELHGNNDETLDHLLAIRLTWEVALLQAFGDRGLDTAWATRKRELSAAGVGADVQAVLAGELLLQSAFEKAYQRQLIETLSVPQPRTAPECKRVQAAFCIDVRSEVFRRAWEAADSDVATIGFAGFFGFPIEYVRLGETEGGAQCPVLLTPQFVISETVNGISSEKDIEIQNKRTLRRRVAKAWRSFKFGAVSCFGFVGPVGLAYVKKLIVDIFGKSRPVEAPAFAGLDKAVVDKLGPRLEPIEATSRMTGMSLEEQITAAAGALTAMSLTSNFARFVMLVGHGSTTVNNPYATGLDCGACGGHSGEANVRVAAMVLNNPAVRVGLQARGIAIPEDTHFLACLHDTTTDEITIFDRADMPESHAAELAEIEMSLAAAGRIARAERAPLLKIAENADVDSAMTFRSRDWSQVRPEWGLAGCAAFIVAPRERTYGHDLGGRAFLHSYDWQQDDDFGVLELIMTAPMVVASWINLQYYGSTVDNQAFGSGNKVLHNVVGTVGVLEGNGGDLRTGLPWQSVHDGETYIHEPLRLNVMIEAPIDAMTEVIARHETVRQLVDHGWLHLFAIDELGCVSHRYQGNLTWVPVGKEQ